MINDDEVPAYWVQWTGADAARCTEIVLRDLPQSRLIFRGLLTNNQVDHSLPVKGELVLLRKNADGTCETDIDNAAAIREISKGRGLRIPLDSSETDRLVRYCLSLRDFYERHGLPTRGREPFTLIEHAAPTDREASSLIEQMRGSVGVEALVPILSAVAKSPQLVGAVEQLVRLDALELGRINTIAGLGALKKALELWDGNSANADEKYWQRVLKTHSFLFAQAFSSPVVFFEDEAYVGGKGIENQGGKHPDFLLLTAATSNLLFVELKAPTTELLGPLYRTDVYPPSPYLAGAVAQVVRQKETLLKNFYSLAHKTSRQFHALNPQCLVVAGHTRELKDDRAKLESFELFRNNLKECEVITFDELFEKTRVLVSLLESTPGDSDAPF